ncbi:anhydro-N-acetylmuramic acid kinase, partial [Serratia ureilytica]|nr:anhydro-N-acetylmuramic acid kinase [Serratia ureilytica]
CRNVSVFIKTSPHSAGEGYYSNMGTARLQTPSNDSRDIIAMAVRALESIWQEGRRYLKGGVMLGDFSAAAMAQIDLFDDCPPRRNSERLMATLDRLNQEGRGRVWFAGQGIVKPWQMKRDMLSPAYTTRLADIPVVRLGERAPRAAEPEGDARFSMQLGDNNRIAALTNITTVGDFRRRDMAYGGQARAGAGVSSGAAGHPVERRMVLNIGGDRQ